VKNFLLLCSVQIKTEKSLACTTRECSDLKASCLITVNGTEAASLCDLTRTLITFKALQNEEFYSYKQGCCQLLLWVLAAGEILALGSPCCFALRQLLRACSCPYASSPAKGKGEITNRCLQHVNEHHLETLQ